MMRLAQRAQVEQPQRREQHPQESLPDPGRRRDVGVARQQQREHHGEGDERQALVRHEDDRADEQQREARADLRHVGGAGDQGKDDQDCAEHEEAPRFAMAKL